MTLARVDWQNSTLIRGDVVRAVAELKDQAGGELQIHRSGDLAQTLMRDDLIDVYGLTTQTRYRSPRAAERQVGRGVLREQTRSPTHSAPQRATLQCRVLSHCGAGRDMMKGVDDLVTEALDARTRMERADAERREAAASWRDAVATLYLELGATATSRRLGITRERVHQIARDAGVGRTSQRRVSVTDPVPSRWR